MMLAAYVALAVSSWGVQCQPQVEWAERVSVGSWPAQSVVGYAAGTRLGGVTYPGSCRIYMSAEWWRQQRHPRYRCDIVHHEVGHIALSKAGIPSSQHHAIPGPMSKPVGQAFPQCRTWYRTTGHYCRSLYSWGKRIPGRCWPSIRKRFPNAS